MLFVKTRLLPKLPGMLLLMSGDSSLTTQTQINREHSENIQLLLGPLIVASEGNFTVAETEDQQMDFSILSATQQECICNTV